MAKKTNGLSFYQRKKKISSKQVHEVLYWILSVLIVIFVACALVYFFGMKSEVIGSSMESELSNGQSVLIDRFRFVLFNPKAGNVVVFLPNGNENSHYYTKRVVAVPGDKVLIEDGKLYVNGELSEEITEYIEDGGIAKNELTLANGEYFVMGDSPSESEDSRSTSIGPVSSDDIIGLVWFKLPCEDGEMGFVN